MANPIPIHVSVVVPVYRSEECIAPLVEALIQAFTDSGRSHEFILVNDCSPDRSWERIFELSKRFPSLIGIDLRRNFGQDNAIMAGLNYVQGKVIIIMDDDLQHDPKDIERLVVQVENGWDVCYARFRKKKQVWWKNAGSWLNGKVASWVIGKPPNIYLSPFKAITRDVAQEIVKYNGPYPYVDGLLFRITNRITQVDVEHHERHAGESNYNLFRSIRVWLKLATGFSLAPLRFATCLGFVVSAFGILLAAFFIVRHLLDTRAPMGWASTIVTILILGGAQLACLGMIGEYLGRAYLNLSCKPQYVIRGKSC